jgi:hypothetical protein
MSGVLPFTSCLGSTAFAYGNNVCPSSSPWGYVFDQNDNEMGINNDDYGGGNQCASNTDNKADFTVTNPGPIVPESSTPQAFPDLIYGCSNTECYDAGFPAQVSSLPQWFGSATLETSSVTGKWDAGYDLWFNRTDSVGPSRGTEIFININRSYAEPTSNYVTTAYIGGSYYDIFEYPRSATIGSTTYNWTYVEFWRQVTTNTSSHLLLNNFMSEANSLGFLNNSWYWTGVDTGFETWYDGNGLELTYNFIT